MLLDGTASVQCCGSVNGIRPYASSVEAWRAVDEDVAVATAAAVVVVVVVVVVVAVVVVVVVKNFLDVSNVQWLSKVTRAGVSVMGSAVDDDDDGFSPWPRS